MCISEFISVGVMMHIGFRCLEPALIYSSKEFSTSCAYDFSFGYTISEGYHYGTIFRDDLMPGPAKERNQLADETEILQLWVLDCWLMNRDRDTYGNVLLAPAPKGKWFLVAADHSDCFMGADYFCSGRCFEQAAEFRAVKYLDFFEAVVYDKGVTPIKETIAAVVRCADELSSITQHVPPQWWDEAGIGPDALERCLINRANNIEVFCDLGKWEGIANAISGGQQILGM